MSLKVCVGKKNLVYYKCTVHALTNYAVSFTSWAHPGFSILIFRMHPEFCCQTLG